MDLFFVCNVGIIEIQFCNIDLITSKHAIECEIVCEILRVKLY